MTSFVHLHVHSEYSLLDGAARIKDLVKEAAARGMTALALTDHGVMYGAVAFYKACLEQGIKPIIGCEMYITSGAMEERKPRSEQPIYHLILLAKNETGYRNLMKLSSEAHLRGFHYRPRIDKALLQQHAEGLVCLSSCLGGEISQHLLHGRRSEARESALWYKEVFGEDYYLELQDHGMVEQKRVVQEMLELSKETGIAMAATNDVHYVDPTGAAAQDILICIGMGKTIDDQDRMKMGTNQMYLKSPEEMSELFKQIPEALSNTVRIAERCELQLELGKHHLPRFEPLPSGMSSGQYLARLCFKGLESRYAGTQEGQSAEFIRAAQERLKYELDVIERMGFSDYFLIVWDFIRYAHEQGIRTGPGRGSSAGSLVAYTLRITDVDPLKYKLLFERFLNPERITMPDIDIDFNDERRDEVIAYVVRKYGSDRVAQIITFGTMAAKAAVRDVGRVLNLAYPLVDKAAKFIPSGPGVTIQDALQENSDFSEYAAKSEEVQRLLEAAQQVEGMPRHASTHAAGVVISGEPLTNYVPLQEGTAHTPLTQYSMEHIEAVGLLKMDFLGLRTISIIERTLSWIQNQTGNKLQLRKLPDDDAATYDLLSRGDTLGIFQLESAGMRKVLRELIPTRFEDIISVLALYRPGPMEFIPKYIQGKHGLAEVQYPHPALKEILEDTYGIIVYQEQIMQIAYLMAGFSLGEADLLRRAVSKKKREVLDRERSHFVQGCLKQGYAEKDAERVYDMIVRFADYGFPRAHAAAYGILAYQTAYLKAHYPTAFMASMLTANMGNHRKVAEYIDECRRSGIDVLPPDVNESGELFTPVGWSPQAKGAVRFGLAAVKNVGAQAIEAILAERKKGIFKDLLDFCRRVDLRVCNKRVLESLILCGAFDRLGGHRAQLLAVLEDTLEAAIKWKKDRADLQIDLFGFEETWNMELELPNIREYTTMERLSQEKELLGLYLSGHPLDGHRDLLSQGGIDPVHTLVEQNDQSIVLTAGMVMEAKTIYTKKGHPMAFIQLEDQVDQVEVVFFPEVWGRVRLKIEKNALLLIKGKVQHQDEGVKLLAEEAELLDSAESQELILRMKQIRASKQAKQSSERTPPSKQSAMKQRDSSQHKSKQRVYIKITSQQDQSDRLETFKTLLLRHHGEMEVVLFYERDHRAVALGERYLVKPSKELIREIEALLGPNTVKIK